MEALVVRGQRVWTASRDRRRCCNGRLARLEERRRTAEEEDGTKVEALVDLSDGEVGTDVLPDPTNFVKTSSKTANNNLNEFLSSMCWSDQSGHVIFLFQIHFVLLISRQGKVRLTKWYSPYAQKERSKVIRELSGVILTRGPKLCNFVEWRGYKVVYRRYASLYFCMCIDANDNELEMLEIIHHFVEILDRYFGSVCELDLIFNFHKAYYILDEILIAGELQESSKKTVARLIAAQDSLVETAKEEASSISNMIAQATK
ncbi:AP-1 complex subunit sigma-1-like [Asparagus officinalis]|uniref:AP-1 complex subunit sigma-1-like n=1 Tax=Asparagus officinalis TaxID=4686 RepID=UPI00098DEF09|nr:AP-1 complex subunit sigma-1-like [Asparagus officinalis]